mmetsp:Transcript_11377/g.13562  ORF Transcript_11377/g.13562 Transcript_11377/m.13562 type:complete len:293 (-) Transcript_11377:107-985(-)
MLCARWFVGSASRSESVKEVVEHFAEMMRENEKAGRESMWEGEEEEKTEPLNKSNCDDAVEGNSAAMAVRKLLRADANATMEHANIDAKDVLATASPQPSSSFFSSSRRRRRRSGADSSKTNSRATEVFMMLQQGSNFIKYSSSGKRCKKRVLWIGRSRLFWASSRSSRLAKSLPLSTITEVGVGGDGRHQKLSFSLRLKADGRSIMGRGRKLIRLAAETEQDYDRWLQFLVDVSRTNRRPLLHRKGNTSATVLRMMKEAEIKKKKRLSWVRFATMPWSSSASSRATSTCQL